MLTHFTLGTLPAPSHPGRVVRLGDISVLDTGTLWTPPYPLWSLVSWPAYSLNGHDALLGDLSAEC